MYNDRNVEGDDTEDEESDEEEEGEEGKKKTLPEVMNELISAHFFPVGIVQYFCLYSRFYGTIHVHHEILRAVNFADFVVSLQNAKIFSMKIILMDN